ncbi:MAG TPA: hypothetical protein VH158_03905 [Gemmatimonadales bacterium]|jgi:hypothetical protein|nr:hypothetical protein [Gemmatimonadales bacterium]
MKRLAMVLAVVALGACQQKPAAQTPATTDTSHMMMADTSKHMMMADTSKKAAAPAPAASAPAKPATAKPAAKKKP